LERSPININLRVMSETFDEKYLKRSPINNKFIGI
jgi:hypothetical protein